MIMQIRILSSLEALDHEAATDDLFQMCYIFHIYIAIICASSTNAPIPQLFRGLQYHSIRAHSN